MAAKFAARRSTKSKPAKSGKAALTKHKAAKAKAVATRSAPAKPEPAEPTVPPAAAPKPAKARQRVTAERMGEMQREISISEFFTKNRHLLGFDSPSRALLTAVKEAVDNSLDACEEASILPDVIIRISQVTENRYKMLVEDNGPGIVKAQIPKVFGKLLYGSKFHRLRQSRGQQGIGISAAGMYGQLTTGKPIVVTSKTSKNKPAHHYHITIDTAQNKPVIPHEDEFDWAHKDHGTSVEIEMEAVYKGGRRSVDEYVQQVAVANPHARIEYYAPGKAPIIFPRLTEVLPPETREIKPHPYGVELGILQNMIKATTSRALGGFLQGEFSRVSGQVAEEICAKAGLKTGLSLKEVGVSEVEAVYKAISQVKIMAPPTNCLAPIGERALLEGLKALLVQRHFAAEEAKAKEAAPPPQDAAAVQKVEATLAQALQEVAPMVVEAEEEEGEPDERVVEEPKQGALKTKAAPRQGKEQELLPPPEPETPEEPVAGVINVFGKPCFVTAIMRAPKVYRGNPFQVEAALAYGGELPAEELATVCRFANRVPLLYQPGACAMTQAVIRTNWRGYAIEQARSALPAGPLLVLVHIASVWVPFTSEAKEAVAHYDEIIDELKLALQECGRRLARHIRRGARAADAEKKARYIEKYIPHIGIALQDILGLDDKKRERLVDELTGILERSRKM